MKKRVLSALLCLCMVLGLVPVTVWAATGNGHTHYLCGGSTCNGSGHATESSITTFATEIKQEGSTLKIGGEEWKKTDEAYWLAGGVYYLSGDIKPDAQIRLNGNVTLCLNGHSITANHDGDVIAVNSGVTFTLTDCKGGNSDAAFGKITHASGKNGRGVYVDSATFNLYGGSITGSTVSSSSSGGGVYVTGNGTFEMSSGSITGNTANVGGGVYVDDGSFKMSGGSITGNTASYEGGGVYVYRSCTFEMSSGTISSNTATGSNGGGVYVEGGKFTMKDTASVSGNTAKIYGGGVYVAGGSSTFKMTGGSITGNNATYGGGVEVYGGKFTMKDSASITGNKAGYGSGVYVSFNKGISGTFNMYGGSITGNTATSTNYGGGGVYANAEFNMYGGSIGGNTATSDNGGGVYVNGGSFTMESGSITGNKTTASGTGGGGVYVTGQNGTFTMKSGSITGNTAQNYGGGVGVGRSGTFNMTGGGITDNTATVAGGGVRVGSEGSFTMTGGSITGNTATGNNYGITGNGGGVYVYDGTFNMNGGSITGNNATGSKSSNGGGVCVYGGTFTMSKSADGQNIPSVSDNTAQNYGGGVYVYGSTFTMNSGSITDNEATYRGGGVYVTSNNSSVGKFIMNGGSIVGNKAYDKSDSSSTTYGGGVIADGGEFEMTDGSITGNTALYGGGVCVSKKFTVSGGEITGNNATGNGGGVYTCFESSVFTVSGNVNITGNTKGGTKGENGLYTKGENGTANNVYLSFGKITIGGLTTGAQLGVTLRKNYGDNAFTSGWKDNMSGKAPADYFISDVGGYKAALDGTELKLVNAHTHSWTYTANGDTITATCKNCPINNDNDFSGGSVTIQKPEKTKFNDGKDENAKVESVDWVGETPSVAYAVKNGNALSVAPVNAGTYTAGITLGNVTVSVTYIIDKATRTAPTGLTTKGDIKNSGTGEIQNTADEMEYNISANATTGWITCDNGSTRVAPGTYYVRYKETDNYYASDVSAALTVDAHTHSGGNATCQEKAVCDGCGQEYGELGNHNFTETVGGMYLKSAATCQSPAVYYKSCLVCDEKSSDTFEYGEKDFSNHIGNTYLVGQKEATCYAEGYTGDTYCSTCNNLISSGEPIAKNAHNPASVWTTDETDHWKECQTVGCGNIIDKAHHSGGEATCVKKAICSVCKEEYGAVDPSNHKHTEVRDAKDATCCEKGYTGDIWCIDCNKIIENGSEIAATGNHTDTDGKWESDDTNHWHTCYFGTKFDVTAHTGGEATCKAPAECSECGHSYGPLDASNHKGTTYLKDQKEATCYDEGYTGDTYCSDCNEKIADGQSIAKNAHNPASVWTTDENYHWKNCQTVGCGNVIDKAAHSGGEATCVSKAVCEVCKAQYGDIDAANHKHTEIRDVKPATEQEKGYTGDTWCTDCNKKIATGSEIAMLEHKLKLVEAKDATVTEQGNIKYYYCEDCGKYFADEDGTKEISLSETVIKKLPPEIIEGNNATVNNGEKKSLTFRSNAAFADFIRVELDGKTLDEKDYTKAEGSIIVTLNNDFVSTLSVGEHTLGIVSESGTATAKFTVKASKIPNKSPKTGDNNMVAFWSFAAVLSLAVLGFTTVVSKKKRAK